MAGIYVNDPAPRNRALELTGNPSLGSGYGLGAVAEESWIRSPFSPLRGQELMEQRAGTEMPATGPVDPGPVPFLEMNAPPPRAQLMTPEEANQRFGIAGELSFDRPVRAGEAALLNKWKRDELKRQNILMRSTPGVLPGAARLGVGFLVSAVDPLNIASAFIPVLGEARFAAIAGRVGVTPARLIRGGVEGAVGAAVVEPLVLLQAQSEQADYDAYDSLLNLAFGTALGGGLHAGFGKLSDWITGQPIELRETALRGALAAVAEDRPVRVAELFGNRREALLGSTAMSSRYATDFSSSGVASGEARNLSNRPEGFQVFEPGSQRSSLVPPSTGDALKSVPSQERTPDSAISSSSSNVYHDLNDVNTLRQLAQDLAPELTKWLEDVVGNIPGVKVFGARAKDEGAITSKINAGKAPNQISDYLGGRIVVDDWAALDRTVDALRRRGDVIEVDDFTRLGKTGLGYRAVHVQGRTAKGLSYEIQVQPREMREVQDAAHELYVKWRRRDGEILSDAEDAAAAADSVTAVGMFADAWDRWTARVGDRVRPFADRPALMDAQLNSYLPAPDEAAQARNIEALAEGWDQPITPETGAEEAAELIAATNEQVQAAKKSGDLDDRDMEAIKGDPEVEKMTKGRAAGYEAAAACLARAA